MRETCRKRRDDIDIVRVKLWYEEVRYRLSLKTSYQVEKAIEPMAFGKNEYGDPYHNNKWSGYAVGRHTPNKRLVELVEQQLRGTSEVLNNILWEAMRGHKGVDWLIKEGIRYLPWEIQRILYKYNKDGLSNELFSFLYTKELLRLERLAGLDSLAALIIFLRIADSQNYRVAAFDIGCSIYRVLLIVCTFSYYREYNAELLQLMKRYVFPLTHNGNKCVAVENEEGFTLEVKYLNKTFLELECEKERCLTRKQKIRVMLDIIHGSKNFIHKLIFITPFELRDESTTDNVANLLDIQKTKRWTTECLKRGIAPLSIDSVEFSPFSH